MLDGALQALGASPPWAGGARGGEGGGLRKHTSNTLPQAPATAEIPANTDSISGTGKKKKISFDLTVPIRLQRKAFLSPFFREQRLKEAEDLP